MITTYKPMVYKIAGGLPVFSDGPQYDDYVSAGLEGMLKAWRIFDTKRDIPFNRFVRGRVRNAMIDEFRMLKRTRRKGVEDVVIDDIDIDYINDDKYKPTDGLFKIVIMQAVSLLSRKKASIILSLYFDGDTGVEVSQKYKVSPQYVSNLHVSALKDLRKIIGDKI